jgi:hypothetical protein
MTDRVYEPEVQQDNPFPSGVVESVSQTQGSGNTITPTTTKEKSFPTRRIATELISTALNTKSKKIMQEFELTQSGGFKIGNFKDGVSGEILITPSGIVTKDKTGLVTIAMYGEDGSGVFKGSIQAGSLITGIVDVGDNSIVIDGEAKRMIFYDDNGIPSILIGNP